MTQPAIADILFVIAAILFAIEFSQNRSLMTLAMALVSLGLFFAF